MLSFDLSFVDKIKEKDLYGTTNILFMSMPQDLLDYRKRKKSHKSYNRVYFIKDLG